MVIRLLMLATVMVHARVEKPQELQQLLSFLRRFLLGLPDAESY